MTVYLPTDPPRPAPPILTAEEVCLLCRFEGSKQMRTLTYYREKGLLPGIKLGRAVRFRLEDVLKFLAAKESE